MKIGKVIGGIGETKFGRTMQANLNNQYLPQIKSSISKINYTVYIHEKLSQRHPKVTLNLPFLGKNKALASLL